MWKTHVTSEGIFFQCFDALFWWRDEGCTVIRPRSSFHMSFVVDDVLYLREHGRGLLRLQGASLQPVPGGERFADERVYVMLPFADDTILVGSRESGLHLLSGDGTTPFTTEADELLARDQAV